MSARKHTAAFVGVGHSRIMRHDDVPLGILAIEACKAAVADAGLGVSQIDGITCTPDPAAAIEGSVRDGMQFVSTTFMARALGIDAVWGENIPGLMSRSVSEAINAVEAGACNYALVFRALHSPSGSYGHTSVESAPGPAQFTAPYGLFTPGMFSRVWHEYRDKYRSGSREQMATLVIQERANGLLNKNSYWSQNRPEKLSVDDYLNARMVSTPFSIQDCDIPVQACGAFVLTTAERAADLRHPPAFVRGVGTPVIPMSDSANPISWKYQSDCAKKAGAALWRDAGVSPAEIDVANMYDGFSFLALLWLEALGFCGEGEAFDFIQGGRIAPDGALPMNPGGGSLGTGRFHGITHLMDAILQVTDRAGSSQVPNTEMVALSIGPPSIPGAFVIGRGP
jgi:acetyl-CoA acetyltransferase